MILTKENIKSVNTDELLDEKIKAGRFDEFLLVVPTNRKLRHLKKKIISATTEQSAKKINIETLGTITKKLLQISKQFHELSDQAAAIFIEQSVKEIPLVYFNNYNGNIPYGTLEKIKNVISKYKETGVTPELLFEEAENLDRSEKNKAIDIANIYQLYLTKCNELNAFEIGDVYSNLSALAVKEFENNFRMLYPSADLIIIDGFDEFTPLELSILNKLSFVKRTKFFLNFDYYSYNPFLFAHLNNTYEKLEQFGFKALKDKREVNPNPFIDTVRKRLFLKTSNEPEKSFENNVIKITAPNREKEVIAIAKEIKTILLKRKAEPHEISVTFNLIKNYSALVRDIFASYGIPFNLTDRLKLDNSLSVVAVLSFLEILVSDFFYKNIIRAFSNSYISLNDFDMGALFFSAANLKIVVGRDNWKYSLKQGIAFEEELTGLSKSKKKINKYKQAAKTLDNIDDLLTPFKKELPPLDFYNELNKLTHKLNIPQNILESGSKGKETEIKALTTFLDSAKETFDLITKEYGTEKTFPLQFYLEKLATLSTSTRFNIKERSDYGVLITNINELRGLNFKYSFIGGMIDGDFPTRYRPEIFFSGSFKKNEFQHLKEERFRFYQALSSWEKGLYLSYPEGEEYTISTFMNDFEKSFSVTHKKFKDYDNFIYSQDEGEKNIPLASEKFPVIEKRELWQEQSKQNNIRLTEPHTYSAYNGFVYKKEIENGKAKSDEKPYSISQLESYTQCPFKYFLERVLKIEVAEEPDEDVEAIEIGSLLHSIVYEFYTEITQRNIKLQNCSDQVFSIAENLLFTIAEKHIEKVFNNSPFAFYETEQIFGIGENRKHSILYKFLEYERENNKGLIPKYFETNFGVVDIEQDKSLSQKVPLLLDDIELRGKIDRIDTDDKQNLFEVIDYKTGSKKITKTEIEKGLSLQLPIYVWAAKTLLLNATGENYNPAAMSIYSLKYKEDSFGKNPVSLSRSKKIDPTTLINESVEIALEHVKKSVAGIREGKFPITYFLDEQEKICKFCNYKMICRIDSIKK